MRACQLPRTLYGFPLTLCLHSCGVDGWRFSDAQMSRETVTQRLSLPSSPYQAAHGGGSSVILCGAMQVAGLRAMMQHLHAVWSITEARHSVMHCMHGVHPCWTALKGPGADLRAGEDDTAVTERLERLLRVPGSMGLHTRAASLAYLGGLFRGPLGTPPHHTDMQARPPRCACCLCIPQQLPFHPSCKTPECAGSDHTRYCWIS